MKTANARYTVQSHQTSHGVSYETARSDLRELSEQGFLEQRKSGRAFVFVPIANLRAKLEGKPTASP